MVELIAAIGFAIVISAGCSLFEAVLYSVPTRYIEILARDQKRSGHIFKELRANIDRPISAVLSLNTIANTAGAAIAGSAATAVFGQEWLFYFSAAFTLAILVFSEIIPKTAGVVYSRALAPYVALPLSGLVKIMTPAIWLCSFVTRTVARDRVQETVSPEELRTMAQMSLRVGGIKPYQLNVIDNILSLENIAAKDVMTPRTVIFSLSAELTLEEASRASANWEHSRFPVYRNDLEDIVGIVLTKELFMSLAQGKKDLRLSDIMRPVHFVAETAKLDRVLMEFITSRQHLFVVLDEYGGLSGLITLEDILEEILGREIMDESDQVADKRALARLRRTRIRR